MMKNNQYKIVLEALLIEKLNEEFYYEIVGEKNWQSVFEDQKRKYTNRDVDDKLIYSVPWYYGRKCNICENDFNGKLFFDINELEKIASAYKSINQDYWQILAAESNDPNWLSKSKHG